MNHAYGQQNEFEIMSGEAGKSSWKYYHRLKSNRIYQLASILIPLCHYSHSSIAHHINYKHKYIEKDTPHPEKVS